MRLGGIRTMKQSKLGPTATHAGEYCMLASSSGDSAVRLEPGDFIKFEMKDDATGEAEWVWLRIDCCAVPKRLTSPKSHWTRSKCSLPQLILIVTPLRSDLPLTHFSPTKAPKQIVTKRHFERPIRPGRGIARAGGVRGAGAQRGRLRYTGKINAARPGRENSLRRT